MWSKVATADETKEYTLGASQAVSAAVGAVCARAVGSMHRDWLSPSKHVFTCRELYPADLHSISSLPHITTRFSDTHNIVQYWKHFTLKQFPS
jgi:hypothetical protein